jgi:hypothetical protein
MVAGSSLARPSVAKASATPTVPFAEVLRFTGLGLGRRAAVDLVRAAILEELPTRAACEVTPASLDAWLTEHRNNVLCPLLMRKKLYLIDGPARRFY